MVSSDAREIARIGFECGVDGFISIKTVGFGLGDCLEHAFVVVGDHLHKFRQLAVEIGKNGLAVFAAGEFDMALDQLTKFLDLDGVFEFFQSDHGLVATIGSEVARLVEDVGDTARHTRCEVAARVS